MECEYSSAGRARPCQGRGHEFEPRYSLQIFQVFKFEDNRLLQPECFNLISALMMRV